MAIIIAVLAYIVIVPRSNMTSTPPTQQTLAVNGSSSSSTTGTQWKTYSNTKYGITFQYPSTWKLDSEAEPTWTNGGIKGLNVSFITDAQEYFWVSYQLAPAGIDGYKTVLADYNSPSREDEEKNTLNVNGVTALEEITTSSGVNIVRHEAEQQKNVTVEMLDKTRGSVSLTFTTPTNSMESTELNEFNQLLSTFKFM